MKKLLLLVVSLLICLALSACGDNNSISGEVVEVTSTALILETDEGKQIAVLLKEDTHIFGMDDIDGDSYKASPHTGVQISLFHDGRSGSVTTSGGTRVKAYRAGSYIHIDAYFIPEAAILSDGTILDAWRTRRFGTAFQTKEGVILLREYVPSGPENHYVGGLESFDDLSETAKPKVTEFYAKQGKLYDLQAELERAWIAYQADAETFSTFVVEQYTNPAGSSEQVFYFWTTLSQTVSGNSSSENILCQAFDRETGANIPLTDLFTCPSEDIGKNLLDVAVKDGSAPSEPAAKAEFEAAFRLENLTISQNGVWIKFPQGTIPSQDYTFMISVEFNADCKKLLHSWAVPHRSTQ